jgi:hypothetical protein
VLKKPELITSVWTGSCALRNAPMESRKWGVLTNDDVSLFKNWLFLNQREAVNNIFLKGDLLCQVEIEQVLLEWDQ